MSSGTEPAKNRSDSSEQILGIQFFNGNSVEAVARALRGELVVAPSATCFERFVREVEYRRAILSADLVLPDSGLMVLLWKIRSGRSLRRISGLAYLRQLLTQAVSREAGRVLWILPNERSREKLLAWSQAEGHGVAPDDCYLAPIYGRAAEDASLLALVRHMRPQQIIIAIGAGAQEKLGLFLREKSDAPLGIHCIGGALGFITGDQVAIPDWADRLYLGWLFRLLTQPDIFLPRLWKARILPMLIFRYGSSLPPLQFQSSASDL